MFNTKRQSVGGGTCDCGGKGNRYRQFASVLTLVHSSHKRTIVGQGLGVEACLRSPSYGTCKGSPIGIVNKIRSAYTSYESVPGHGTENREIGKPQGV